MRQRSMSVYDPKDGNRLSKRFEGVVSDAEDQSDLESDDDTKDNINPVCQAGWSKTDYDVLLEKLRAVLPKKDTKKFSSRLQTINWTQIEVRNHSPADVEQTVKLVLAKIRRFRTLEEMLTDAPEVISKLLNAEKPKAPPSAYTLFMKENMPRWKGDGIDSKNLFKTASKEFHDMSVKKKRKYEEAAGRLKEEHKTALAKYYEEHPDMVVKQKTKRIQTNKTPFNLFLSARRETSDNITLAQARKEWEDLPHKKKLKYVQESFAAQSTGKWLNKKEQEMLDRFHGKPEFVGRNAFEFFIRKTRSRFEPLNMSGKTVQQKIREEYHKLSPREILDLKDEYALAREQYITQYRAYISNLPPDKQEAELEHIRSLTEKSTKPKQKKKDEVKVQPKEEEFYPGSADEDPPVAESTAIKKPTKAKKQKTTVTPVELEAAREKSPTKRPNESSPLRKQDVPEPSLPSKVKVAKVSEKKKKNVEVPREETLAVATTSSTNHSDTPKAQTKKRSSNESTPATATKRSKKQNATVQQEVKQEPLKEPEKPPSEQNRSLRNRRPVGISRGRANTNAQ
ncbi:upstream-binding factor 1-like protein 1 isoform X2 [Wyeomyia smithii]|uniref:upstream-binding factor 1-like protein 1 isoform X2 n=1 Tax=Wyeomyia smithii TaxID=174621 RepID=UPI002467C6E8|nr:upstream-binding factor 1-like protein 1 isoform X2 [Wyeomyia smithii]